MWFALIYLAGIGIGGLCYPRRPRATGAIFMSLGAALLLAWMAGAISGIRTNILFASASWMAAGAWVVWKFRTAASRRSHLAEWTARS